MDVWHPPKQGTRMTCALQIFAFDPAYPLNGRYVMDFDVGAYDPYDKKSGPVPTTDKIAEAKHFTDTLDALTFWKTPSRVRRFRPDGERNRPLTGFSVQIVKVPE